MRSAKSALSRWAPSILSHLALATLYVIMSPLGVSTAWADYAGVGGSSPPEVVLTNFFAIIISLTIHEFAHAWVADRLGDPTPGRYNRLNLNPLTIIKAHPFGALLIPLFGSMNGFLIGFAATPVNPHLVRRQYSLRQAQRWISLAGPVSNVLLAIISVLTFVALEAFVPTDYQDTIKPLMILMGTLVLTNIFFALFNLIPVPPLDGFTALENALPREYSHIIELINQYKGMIIIFVLFFGGQLLSPLVSDIFTMLLAGARSIVGVIL